MVINQHSLFYDLTMIKQTLGRHTRACIVLKETKKERLERFLPVNDKSTEDQGAVVYMHQLLCCLSIFPTEIIREINGCVFID